VSCVGVGALTVAAAPEVVGMGEGGMLLLLPILGVLIALAVIVIITAARERD